MIILLGFFLSFTVTLIQGLTVVRNTGLLNLDAVYVPETKSLCDGLELDSPSSSIILKLISTIDSKFGWIRYWSNVTLTNSTNLYPWQAIHENTMGNLEVHNRGIPFSSFCNPDHWRLHISQNFCVMDEIKPLKLELFTTDFTLNLTHVSSQDSVIVKIPISISCANFLASHGSNNIISPIVGVNWRESSNYKHYVVNCSIHESNDSLFLEGLAGLADPKIGGISGLGLFCFPKEWKSPTLQVFEPVNYRYVVGPTRFATFPTKKGPCLADGIQILHRKDDAILPEALALVCLNDSTITDNWIGTVSDDFVKGYSLCSDSRPGSIASGISLIYDEMFNVTIGLQVFCQELVNKIDINNRDRTFLTGDAMSQRYELKLHDPSFIKGETDVGQLLMKITRLNNIDDAMVSELRFESSDGKTFEWIPLDSLNNFKIVAIPTSPGSELDGKHFRYQVIAKNNLLPKLLIKSNVGTFTLRKIALDTGNSTLVIYVSLLVIFLASIASIATFLRYQGIKQRERLLKIAQHQLFANPKDLPTAPVQMPKQQPLHPKIQLNISPLVVSGSDHKISRVPVPGNDNIQKIQNLKKELAKIPRLEKTSTRIKSELEDQLSHSTSKAMVYLDRQNETQNTSSITETIKIHPKSNIQISIPGYLKLDFLNDLRVYESLGSGASGTVFLGSLKDKTDIDNDSFIDVAVKTMENGTEFRFEVALLGSIGRSAYVVLLLGYFDEPYYGIVMKLYDGNLKKYIHDTKSIDITLKDVIKIAHDICQGMKHVHKHKIVHFDLKPLNIFVDYNNQDVTETITESSASSPINGNNFVSKFHCAIGDLGNAKLIGSSMLSSIAEGIVRGLENPHHAGITAAYCSPEVLNDYLEGTLCVCLETHMKADVYSFALVMLEVITRSFPWPSVSYAKGQELVKFYNQGGTPEIPQSAGKILLESGIGISKLLSDCWKRNPHERPDFGTILEEIKKQKI